MTKSKAVLFLIFICLTVLTVCFHNIPFFWDGTYFSKAASLFYSGNSSFFNCDKYTDNTMLPMYSAYLALAWSVFSKSLWVSHLVFLPFVLWLFYETYRFAKKYLTPLFSSLSLILLLVEPTVITQSILMGYDIILACLFLFTLNRRIEKQNFLFSFGLSVLALFSIRGLFLAFSCFFVDWFLKKQDRKNVSIISLIRLYSPAIFFVSAWFVYHKIKTGWFIFSPLHENTDETLVPFSMVFRQLVYVVWKNIDFGRVLLWTSIFIFSFQHFKHKETFKKISVFLFVPLFFTAVFMAVVSNPVGHKYFIFSFPLLIVLFCFCLEQLPSKKKAFVFFAFTMLVLLSGNFWWYPQKYGNGWDSSLKVLPYFSLKSEMDSFITQEKIDKSSIATQFPIDANDCYSYLKDSCETYTAAQTEDIAAYDYFLYSTIMNPRETKTIEEIRASWKPIKIINSGLVSLCLYKKP
jgi:hypothetical protein